MEETIETLFDDQTRSGILRINDLQICWGQVTVEKVPKAVWARKISAKFPKPFIDEPTVTHGINTHSNGHGVAVYNWNLTKEGFTGGLNNMHVINKADPGKVTMDYMAIGRWRC